uniref:DNA damage-binding protein 1 n=1 Tax=Arcella intermedia TaxID=1963864 RepID=A0A6B2KWM6_9EUKA
MVGNFTGPNDLNLILCKSTLIEIYTVGEDGLESMLDVNIYGRISSMFLYRNPGEDRDQLFLLTEKGHFCVLGYDAQKSEIITKAIDEKSLVTSIVNDEKPAGVPASNGQIAIVDPEARMIGLHLHEGFFKVIPIEKGQLQTAYDIRLEETQIIEMKFLHGCVRPTLMVLYHDAKESRHIKTYEIVPQKEFIEGPWQLPNIEPSVELVITLPPPLLGILVIGERSIIYHKGNSITTQKTGGTSRNCSLSLNTPKLFKVFGKIDNSGRRILLGESTGALHCLILQGEGDKVTKLQLEYLGVTSIPSTIDYLDNGLVFVGSTTGDSQLIRLTEEKTPEGYFFNVLDRITNLGSIVDFAVVDINKQNQGQMITCSGALKDGSLRVVRNGIGVQEHAQVDLKGIKGLWSIDPCKEGEVEKYLIVSFVAETRILSMVGEELVESNLKGFDLDKKTIYAGNLIGDLYIQVTAKGISLIDGKKEMIRDTWIPEAQINLCSANATQILIAQGKDLSIFQIQNQKLIFKSKRTMDHEISCLNINPIEHNKNSSSICVVGLWTDISVRLLSVPDLVEIRKLELGGEILPRSVILKTLDHITYLIIALGDGNLLSYTYDMKSGDLENRKKLTLGTRPVILNDGHDHIFACSDRPSVIQHTNTKKLLFAPVNLKDVTYMCSFDCPSFPNSIALSNEDTLTIGTVDHVQKLHISTIPLGEVPRRIAYQDQSKTLCLLTVKTLFDGHGDVEEGWVKLLDARTFEIQDVYPLQADETPTAVASVSFSNNTIEYYVVGTAYIKEEPECSSGRILLFEGKNRKLRLQAELLVTGAVYSLDGFQEKIIAGVNSKVLLLKWDEASKELSIEFDYEGQSHALHVVTKGDFILVGDLQRSMSLLLYTSVDGTIKESARDYNPLWMTAVSFLDNEHFLGADDCYNIFCLENASSVEDRGKLEVCGEFHVGQFINRIREGSLAMAWDYANEVKGLSLSNVHLFGTISGSVGVVATLDKEHFKILTDLQAQILNVVKGVGGLDYNLWRAWKNDKTQTTRLAKGFVDGDIIAKFLDLPPEEAKKIAHHLDMPIELIQKIVETLTNQLH